MSENDDMMENGSFFEHRPFYYTVWKGRGDSKPRISLSIYDKKLKAYANYNMDIDIEFNDFINKCIDIRTKGLE